MRIGILGSGQVAQALGAGFVGQEHDVMLGTRTPPELADWAAEHGAAVGSVEEAAAHGELLVLAVRGAVASDVLRAAGTDNLDGKPVIDTTNPIADTPPTNGVLHYFTDLEHSLMERLQDEFPMARLVKAFNSVGNRFMVAPSFAGGPPTMFICGADADAKALVTGLLERFGWDVADLGDVQAARAIEPLCILWCIPGLREGTWNHALKLLR